MTNWPIAAAAAVAVAVIAVIGAAGLSKLHSHHHCKTTVLLPVGIRALLELSLVRGL